MVCVKLVKECVCVGEVVKYSETVREKTEIDKAGE